MTSEAPSQPAPEPSARIYIWYPQSRPGADSFGHCSMHIGAGQRVDDRESYLSWWPNGVLAKQTLVPGLGRRASFHVDVRAENSNPHVVYEIYGLDAAAMQAEWTRIVQNDLNFKRSPFGAGWYNMVMKNCSTIVARVLLAGGAAQAQSPRQSPLGSASQTRPHDRAQAALRGGDPRRVLSHAGSAALPSVRIVAPDCPSRRDGSWGSLLAGTRSDFETTGDLPPRTQY